MTNTYDNTVDKMVAKIDYTLVRYESDIAIYVRLRDEEKERLSTGEHTAFIRGVIEGHVRWYNGKIEEKLEAIEDLKSIKDEMF